MILKDLLESLKDYKVYRNKDISINSISDDSRKVKAGGLFIAISGLNYDGHDYINDALKNGAKAVLGEYHESKLNIKGRATYIRVANSRDALGMIASAWYGYPSSKMKIIGITGTDGKTTTANLVHWLLTKNNRVSGLISTINAEIAGKEFDTGFHVTSPEPILLHQLLKKMVDSGCKYAVLEVTSHALHQKRVHGISFDTAVLTNITHEHADYHGSWKEYKEVKAQLFKNVNCAVLNKDDNAFSHIRKKMKKDARLLSYSLKEKSTDVFARNIITNAGITEFDVLLGNKKYHAKTKLLGNYNVLNYLAALSAGLAAGLKAPDIISSLEDFKGLKGRMEEVKTNKNYKIFIDFAHTPNSLENVLKLFKERTGRLIVIFGCAGERDVKKREMMGEISAKYADVSVFTAEDPRSENVNNIIVKMIKGAKKCNIFELDLKGLNTRKLSSKNVFISIPERGEAISFAINKIAQKGDTIVICGKGHEKSIAYNGIEYPWSDNKAIKKALKGEVLTIRR